MNAKHYAGLTAVVASLVSAAMADRQRDNAWFDTKSGESVRSSGV